MLVKGNKIQTHHTTLSSVIKLNHHRSHISTVFIASNVINSLPLIRYFQHNVIKGAHLIC